MQVLWSHAISPFFGLQAGVRYDFEPDSRAPSVLGIEGAVHVRNQSRRLLFSSGALNAPLDAEYHQRVITRLILQPLAEVSLTAQDISERVLAPKSAR